MNDFPEVVEFVLVTDVAVESKSIVPNEALALVKVYPPPSLVSFAP